MSGLYISGLASGLDTDAIISSLMQIEGRGRSRIEREQAAANARRTGLTGVTTKLNALKFAVSDLKSAAVWVDTQAVESADTTKITAKRTAGAGPGGYDVAVTQMASAERRTYAYTPPASASQLTVANQDGTTRATIALAAGASLDDAVAAINASADANLFAVNVNGALVLAARTTGAASEFSLAGAGAQLSRAAGVDATGTVDGVAFQSSTNTVANAIPGLELTLKGETAGTAVTVGGPTPDVDAVKAKVKAFVEKYNDLVSTITTDVTEKRVPGATTTTDAAKGALFGDSGLTSLLSTLRQTAAGAIAGLTGPDELADIGISTGAAGAAVSASSDSVVGKLTLDETKLTDALTKDPRAVQKLLGGSGTDGVAQALEAVITPYTEAGGLLSSRVTAVDGRLTRIKDNLARFDDRLADKEAYYKKMYAALETALSRSNSVAADLAARLGTSNS